MHTPKYTYDTDIQRTESSILHIFLCNQIVNTATVDLEDVRMYRNAIRSRCEMVSVNFSDLDLLKSVQKSKPGKFGLSLGCSEHMVLYIEVLFEFLGLQRAVLPQGGV